MSVNGAEPDDDAEAPPETPDQATPEALEGDEPVPATQDDPQLDAALDDEADPRLEETVDDPNADDAIPIERGPGGGATAPRRRWPFIALAVCAVLGGLGAYLYFTVWAYEPTALRHVPSGANIVIRADAAKLLVFKPVREHLWPLLLEGGADDADKERRVTRIREETGVSIPTDLRELVVASVDGVAWVAVVGGNIEKGRFVTGLAAVLKEERLDGWKLDGELLVHATGSVIGQAEDGTLVLATHREIAEAALPPSDTDTEMPVPTDGAIGFRIGAPAFKRIVQQIPDGIPVGPLTQIDELSGKVLLSDDPWLALEATPKAPTQPPALAASLSGMFSQLGLALLLVPSDLYGAKKAIRNATVSADEDRVHIDARWPYAPLDEAVKLLAKSLRANRSTPEK